MVTHCPISWIHNTKSNVTGKAVSAMPCRHRGRRGTALLILNLSSGWRWEVNFTAWLLYLLLMQEVKLFIQHQVPTEQEGGWALQPVSALSKKRKLSCHCQKLMNSFSVLQGHSPVILTMPSHLSEHVIYAQKLNGFPKHKFTFTRTHSDQDTFTRPFTQYKQLS